MKALRLRELPLLVVVLVAGTACRHVRKTPEQRGEGVFLRSCATCHGPDARGTHPAGFKTPPANLTDPKLQDRLGDEGIRDTIRHGKGQMPPFGALLEPEDVDGVVRYLHTLRRAE
ncbi:MAG TPA: cytochrome c [Polyangiaceae bacterium]|nr:cytochrome c [Polyangiaceae bacterium]